MTNTDDERGRLRQSLSELLDGELRDADVDGALLACRSDSGAADDWRTYALIGDVLRSDELARWAPEGMATGLRARLEQEPTVLVPEVATTVRRRRGAAPIASSTAGGRTVRRYGVPAAMAAGLVLVAGTMVTLRQVDTEGMTTMPMVATGPAPANSPARTMMANVEYAMPTTTAVGVFGPAELGARRGADRASAWQNAADDRYLAAHRDLSPSRLMVVPGGLRNVATTPAVAR